METSLGGQHAVDRFIEEGYYKTRMAGPKGNIEEVACIKQTNSNTVERSAKFNVKIGGNITNAEQLKDRIEEFDEMGDGQFEDNVVPAKRKPAGQPQTITVSQVPA